MNASPFLRVKWSNEHNMAAVFLVLILYHLPRWTENPVGILNFLLLVAAGLFLDCASSVIRYKRIWCCVSAAVTAAMISLLTVGVPLWGQLLGVAIALLVGKQLWGGTGKNILNPAMVGLLAIMLMFDVSYPFFQPSMLLLPAILLSLPFLKFRPFAGIGFLVGMLVAMYINQELTALHILTYGVFFWGTLVITDPVTITDHPIAGSAAGAFTGFATIYYFPVPIAIVVGILSFNLFSAAIRNSTEKTLVKQKAKLRIPKVVPYNESEIRFLDLSEEKEPTKNERKSNEKRSNSNEINQLSSEEVLERIRINGVYGMGGAAFSTYQKLTTLISSKETDQYLIINGVECDPGLIHDAWLLRNRSEEIQKGIEVLRSCLKLKSVHLAVKNTTGLNYSDNLLIHRVPDVYPMGAERILINKILQKQISSDQIPAKQGILVLNVQTVYAIFEAVVENKPITSRFITVADLKKKIVQVVKVSLGMKIRDIMDAVYPGVVNIFAGGGLMQAYLTDEEAAIDKTVNFLATGTFPSYKESPQCSHCGQCSKNCPSGLNVTRIVELADQGKLAETKQYRIQDCIGCGSCSYSCLAGRDLASKVKMAKDAL